MNAGREAPKLPAGIQNNQIDLMNDPTMMLNYPDLQLGQSNAGDRKWDGSPPLVPKSKSHRQSEVTKYPGTDPGDPTKNIAEFVPDCSREHWLTRA